MHDAPPHETGDAPEFDPFELAALEALAQDAGVELEYHDAFGTETHATPRALVSVLRALGLPISGPGDVPAARAAFEAERSAVLLDPVHVSWNGAAVPLRVGSSVPAGATCAVLPEGGGPEIAVPVPADAGTGPDTAPDLPGGMATGYHRIELRDAAGAVIATSTLLSSPARAHDGGPDLQRTWGLFAPLYSLHSRRSWGIGDLGDARRLLELVDDLGGTLVGSTPLLAGYTGATLHQHSPYAPVSRLFWNELYVELERLPEFASDAVRALVASDDVAPRLKAVRAAELLDYEAIHDLKTRVLAACCDELLGEVSPDDGSVAAPRATGALADTRRAAFAAWRAETPVADEYATFRAMVERDGRAPHRHDEGAVPPPLEGHWLGLARYHAFAQWVVEQQLSELDRTTSAGLYLDLPVGIHPDGFDAFREGDTFVHGMSVGAPPDVLGPEGQDWGLAPLHPERARATGHDYFRRCLRHLFRHARAVRIDHVMGLHRLFWVPWELEASEGVYVRMPADELWAITCIESHRAEVLVVGEDLGTVPNGVREAMTRHDARRSYVLEFELDEQGGGTADAGDPADDATAFAGLPIKPAPAGALVTVDTHDTQPWQAFWNGLDDHMRRRIEHFLDLGRYLDPEHHDLDDDGRYAGPDVATAALGWLAGGDAGAIVATLEDFWGETLAQNVPGTNDDQQPNWRRRMARTLDEINADADLRATLAGLTKFRKEGCPVPRKTTAAAEKTAERAAKKSAPKAAAAAADSTAAKGGTATKPKAAAGAGSKATKSAAPAKAAATKAPARQRAATPAAPVAPAVPPAASTIGDQDLYLFHEGTHNRMHDVLGAHAREVDGVAGTSFAVWAPNAAYVSVVGNFNHWDRGTTPMAALADSGGIWQAWVPGVGSSEAYKFHVASNVDGYSADKADPFARWAEVPPNTASVTFSSEHEWNDGDWMQTRAERNALDAPISVYEVHLGSWRRDPDAPDRLLSYREVAPLLVEHCVKTGFTHVEFLPLMEHPFYGSWGYQTTGYFAPTSRYGTPDDLKFLIDQLHQAGIGVLLDWVPSHYPTDEHGIGFFDGTHLFEHADPRQGFHPDWKSFIFNYGRNEVRSFLLSSARYWLEEFHADGLRVDAVASMLYLDYSREDGEWIPNEHGGRENLEAEAFLRRLNEDVYGQVPGVQVIAEESTSWGGVSRPTDMGGLGFGMKWDMGWMHDTLQYLQREPIHRGHHQGELSFRQLYAYTENFMLPLSHDEVVHGKGSLLNKMPGDEWQQFANLRLLLAYMWTMPGKKLLFMGQEWGQRAEWNHDRSLDWHEGDVAQHAGVLRLVGDLNRAYRELPALHELDVDEAGFEWVDGSDAEASVYSYLRKARTAGAPDVLVVVNATPVVRAGYRVGVPTGGWWREVLNTDAGEYWGGGAGNGGGVDAHDENAHGRPFAVDLTLPPLGVVVLEAPAGA